ncbi:MAG: methionyl-tRNA formyltransferase [Myxococcota bacterium]|nr:methionyl-tRNA formyltransferase [Myxococcota bacterium]
MPLKLALFGQAAFGKDVLERLLADGHEVVGVYAPPEGRRPDPLAETAGEHGLRLLRHRYFRKRQGDGFVPIPRILDEHRELGADLNVLAYVTAILPPELVDHPPKRSLCFHPSLLPRFRGGAALAWQIILGEKESGVTVFQPDEGVDTGPIVVQKGGVPIDDADTAGSLYFQKLYPLGVDAVVEAVARVADGSARYEPQDEAEASFQGLVGDAEARIDWSKSAAEIDRLVRGCDPQPGAWAEHEGAPLRLFDARLVAGEPGGAPGTAVGAAEGRVEIAAPGGRISVGRVRPAQGGKVAAADHLDTGALLT